MFSKRSTAVYRILAGSLVWSNLILPVLPGQSFDMAKATAIGGLPDQLPNPSGQFASRDPQRPPIRRLQILVLEGVKAESYPGRPGVPPVIEVRDDLDRPVENAEVEFDLPMVGPGGTFQDGGKRFTTKTNFQGQAMPGPFTTSPQVGPFTVRVSVKYQGLLAQTSVIQITAMKPRTAEAILRPKSSSKKWVVLGVIAGAAGGGVAFALTRGSAHPVRINVGGAVVTQP